MKNRIAHHALALVLIGISNLDFAAESSPDPLANPPSPAFTGQTAAPQATSTAISMDVLLSDIQGSRAIEALPDGSILVAEGSGKVRIITATGSVSEAIDNMPPLRSGSGRKLLDVEQDDNFANNRQLYFTYEADAADGSDEAIGQVASARLSDDMSRLEDIKILGNFPGRRLASTQDGKLFITTTGIRDSRPQVQDLTQYAGKVLRINNDGSVPDDNPFIGIPNILPEIYAIGHRDQDGITLHSETGELWTVEHGPMGGDELNIIRAGENSGWPYITYGKNYDGTEIGPSAWDEISQPLYYWFPSIAPSGLIQVQNDLFPGWQDNLLLGALSNSQGHFLIRLVLDGEQVIAEEHLLVDYDRRIRDVTEGPDGSIYLLTDSEDNADAGRQFSGEVLRIQPDS